VNQLFYGDNLDVLQRHIKDESVDLVYLDPPFKSNQDYNVLFAEKDGTAAAAQFRAFEDTWEWNQDSAAMYEQLVESGGRVSDVMQAFRRFLGTNDMLAYLTMMAPRLVELRRVLKSTGSIYLHCDPTASHYLKILMDAIFGPENFRNEIVWKRSHAHSDSKQGARHYGRVTDSLLFYAKVRR
jgi:adenine specific DNA methylase Mod